MVPFTFLHAGVDDLRTDSAGSQWIEQKDDLIRPVSGFTLADHQFLYCFAWYYHTACQDVWHNFK